MNPYATELTVAGQNEKITIDELDVQGAAQLLPFLNLNVTKVVVTDAQSYWQGKGGVAAAWERCNETFLWKRTIRRER